MSAGSPSQAIGKSSHPARHFSLTPQKQVSENSSAMMRVRGSPWFLSWEILIRCFLLRVCIGGRKESRKLIFFFFFFFCFGNWVWHVLLSKCYPFKHFRGKLVLPASISIMWCAVFSPSSSLALWWKDNSQISQTLTYRRWVDASFLCKLRVPAQV